MEEVQGQSTDYKKVLFKILARWPYIILFFLLSLAIAHAINRYSVPVYLVKAKIITKKFNDRSGGALPMVLEGSQFFRNPIEVSQEIPLLKSQDRIDETIRRLDFTVSYFSRGLIKTTESMGGQAFTVQVDSLEGEVPYGIPLFVEHEEGGETFRLTAESDYWRERLAAQVFRFGQPERFMGMQFRLNAKNGNKDSEGKYYFVINRHEDLVRRYRSRIGLSWTEKGSAMLDLKIESELPEKDLKFMEKYYEVIDEKGLADKNAYASNTIYFISEQMKYISDSLVRFQETIDDMKLDKRELTLGSNFIYTRLNELDEKKAEFLIEQRYYDYLERYIRANRGEEIFAPNMIGLDAPLLTELVNRYVDQKMEEKLQRTQGNALNPLVNREDSIKRRLEKNIYESIKNYRKGNQESINEIDRQSNFLLSSVRDLQGEFRELKGFERMYQLNQSLYDLFLQKRTEASIAKAAATSDYQLIDKPSYSKTPVRPDPFQNYFIAMALGLALPIAFFYVKDVTNKRIQDRDDLLKHLDMPFIGNVGHSDAMSNLVVKEKPKSVVSESFRSIRANLKYFSGEEGKTRKVYLITSSIGGEGKTFCSLNLAYTFAAAGKKTLLVGADMRKPTLTDYMEAYPGQGLSDYLAGFCTMEEVIQKGETENLYFIGGGNVPPNPAELLSSPRLEQLMQHLRKEFDHIIIDTSPIGLVADAMELLPQSDLNILIVRQDRTYKAALNMVNDMYLDEKLNNFVVLFNDIQFGKGYGYYGGYGNYGGYIYGMGYKGYGYGYYDEDKKKKKWWKW